jgi:hypothetical protein
MVLFTISSACFLFVGLSTSIIIIGAILVLRGLAMAFTFIPLQAATFATIRHQDTGQASSIFNTNRQVASSFGVAILATVLTSQINSRVPEAIASAAPGAQQAAANHATLLAFHDAFLASVVLAIIGIVFALIIRDEDAAASMRAPQHEESQEPLAV